MESPAAISAVIIDFGGVFTDALEPAKAQQFEQEFGLQPGTLEEALFGGQLWEDVSQGKIGEAAYWEGLCASFPRPAVGARAAALWSFVFDVTGLRPEMREFTQELRSRGLKLALLSNAGLSLRAVLQTWELVPLFDCVVISAEVGMRKPDPAIFRHAADCLEVPAASCLFVDDREGNVNAALELGMQAIRFESLPQLRAALDGLLAVGSG